MFSNFWTRGLTGRRLVTRVGMALVTAGVAVTVGLLAWAVPTAAASPSCSGTTTVTCAFSSIGSEQTFTVPVGVSSVAATAVGGVGAAGIDNGGAGGFGATVTGELAVTPAEVLYVEVAGNGAGATGGFNGGGNGGNDSCGNPDLGGGGGGASDIRTSPMSTGGSLSSRLLVAAGGGGGGDGTNACGLPGAAGGGGGAAGLPGQPGQSGGFGTSGGGGGAGTQKAGGAGGTPSSDCSACLQGGPGVSGAGGNGAGNLGVPGGGGGGGYYGGGGGGEGSGHTAGGGGGGGSSLVPAGGSASSDTTGTPTVSISYTALPHVCSGTLSAPGVLKGAYPNGVVVKGFCAVNAGKAHVTGTLTVTSGSVLEAAFGMHHSSLTVNGNLVVDKGATALVGCKANPNGTGMACIDDPDQQHPTLTSHAIVSGNIIATKALGLIVHNSAIGNSIKDIGGGGGPSCAVPKTGVFAAFKSPVFSDLEDSTVGGDVRMNGLRTCWFGLARDKVQSYVTINMNKTADPDAIEVLANHIGASLSCSNNRHPGAQPKGALPIWDSADAGESGLYPRVSEPNTVGGSRSGQCVKASPVKLGGPPAAKKF